MSELNKINNCPECGAMLLKERRLHHFSVEDGSKLYFTDVKCPNNNWFHSHYHGVFDEDGNSYPYPNGGIED